MHLRGFGWSSVIKRMSGLLLGLVTAAMLLWTSGMYAQREGAARVSVPEAQAYATAALQARIASERGMIEAGERQHFSEERMGYLWATLAVDYRKAGDFNAAEDAYIRALDLLKRNASSARNYAVALDNFAMLYLTYGRLEEAESYNSQAAKIRSGLGFPLDAARSEGHRAEIDLAKHKFKETEAEANHALQVFEAEHDAELLDVTSALNALAYARCMQKNCGQGMQDAVRSLDLARRHFGADSMPAAHALLAVGFARWKTGQIEEADRTMRTAIEMMRAHPGSERAQLLALAEYRDYLKQVHNPGDAEWAEKMTTEVRNHDSYCGTCINVRSLSNAMR